MRFSLANKNFLLILISTVYLLPRIAHSQDGNQPFSLKFPSKIEFVSENFDKYLDLDIQAPIISVIINEKKFNFIIDTGSEISKVDDAVITEIDSNFLARVKIKINQITKYVNIHKIEELQVANAKIYDLPVSVFQDTLNDTLIEILNKKQVHGILGFSAFKNKTINFNFLKKTFVMSNVKLPVINATALLKIPNESIPIMRATLSNNKESFTFPLVMDTGYFGYFKLPTAHKPLPFELKDLIRCRGIHMQGIEDCTEGTLNAIATFGGISIKFPRVQIGDQNAVHKLKTPYGLVGMGILKKYNIYIDQEQNLINFTR